ncbi:MAG: lamin tail domain-containing protein [Akkermansiaceae bacterium]|nr:lamin tail domain-containing protein [Akkermansiaceae bacterium]
MTHPVHTSFNSTKERRTPAMPPLSLAAAIGILTLTAAPASAGTVVNSGFEDPAVSSGNFDTNVTDWFEEAEGGSLGGFVVDLSAEDGNPAPGGDQWLELISDTNAAGVVYQQIDTWTSNQVITISMLVGNRSILTDSDYAVELWAGGIAGLATNGTRLLALGASQVDTSGTVAIVGNGLSETKSFDLNTGSAHSAGDPLWLRLTQVAQGGSFGGNDVVLFDDLEITNVLDTTPPTIASLDPADDAPEVSVFSELVVTFSEGVSFGTGAITLHQNGGGTIEAFDVESSPNLLLNGASVSINPTDNLVPLTGYYVQIDATAIKDGSDNFFAGISGSTTWSFTTAPPDTTAPTIATLDSPAYGGSANPSLLLNFDEAIQKATGNIVIRRTDDDTVVATIDVSSAKVTVSGARVTIVPDPPLSSMTSLYLEIDAGTFEDLSGNPFPGSASLPQVLSFEVPAASSGIVVINELHIDEDDKTRRGEFIELYNNSDSEVDVSAWFFSSGINQAGPGPGDPAEDFVLPSPTLIPARGYLVIAQDPAVMVSLFGYSGALGPWVGKLSNKGETVTLNDSSGNVIDKVTYQLGWPWPTVGEQPSPSMELINPSLDNDLGGSWRSSGNIPASSLAPADYILREDTQWHYRKGITFPSNDAGGDDWTKNGYDENDDGEWLISQAPFGRGDGDDKTLLSDMQYNYITVFMRHEFNISAGQVPSTLTFRALYDDGLVLWINGVEVHRYSVEPGTIAFPPPSGFANSHEARGNYEEVTVTGAASYLVEGTNTIAVQLINTGIGSSDSTSDVEVVFAGSSGGGAPTNPSPGAANTVFSNNAPPAMRQVNHLPEQPASTQAVTVTAKVTDSDGVAKVSLEYQLVDPGDYIKLSDPRYDTEWTSVPMLDDGSTGDALGGDDTYTVILPGTMQTHRRLVRYRINATDTLGANVRGPYTDDPQPNFAYFVYDTIPTWTGSARPGVAPDVTYDFNALPLVQQQVPVYHLITTREEHEDSQHIPSSTSSGYTGSDYLWEGTLVYDGRIYDHISFRARGGVWRYAMGKNMWKFDFNRGRRFEARDQYGERYDTDWRKLNFAAIVQHANFNQRGEQGLFECGGFRLHNLAGNPASKTHYVHFRIIEHADENGPTASQFDTDFQGLYLALEQMDGQFLEEHDLPDGNFYKMESGTGELNNQGPDQPTNKADLNAFFAYKGSQQTQQWWEDNLNLEDYYNFRAIATAIDDSDIGHNKNYFYFHDPVADNWRVLNWDLDGAWTNIYTGLGTQGPLSNRVLAIPDFARDYRNRLREILDLLFNDDQTGKVLDECARFIYTPGIASLVDADRAMWDYNPILISGKVNATKAGHGHYYEAASPETFAGMINHVKGHIADQTANPIYRNFLNSEAATIPAKPIITYIGAPGFPSTDLSFQSSNFSDPQGSGTFGGMQWRIGEIYNESVTGYVSGEPFRYEIEDVWTSEILPSFNATQDIPLIYARPGGTYRARVRHLDTTGNWGHWSDPVEFTVSGPDVSFFQQSLVISEFMYHPTDASSTELALGFSSSDFEWIEMRNVGTQAVDMTNLRFTKGVDFDFPDSCMIPADGYVILARSRAGFEHRYGNSHPLVGEYGPDKLSNAGENVKLSLGAGTQIIEFIYDDIAPWPAAADGDGFSLVLIDPESLPLHSDPANWQISAALGGTPGADEFGLTFAAWKAATGVTGAENDDDDFDSFSNLLEYATGSDGTDPTSANHPSASVQVIGASEYLFFSFRKRIDASDLNYTIEFSPGLAAWQPLDAVFVSSVSNGDGTTTETWRSAQSGATRSRNFVHLRVTKN